MLFFFHPKKNAIGADRPNGLVMIQIDGLARPFLEKAIAEGRMPFLESLIRKHHYGLDTLYSGMPSNTPAVQGELFYGIKQCVPAFQYRDQKSRKMFTLYKKECAGELEARLAQKGEALLAGGSSYGNIFCGGAAEPHFCIPTLTLKNTLASLNPMRFSPVFVTGLPAFLKIVALGIYEVVLGLVDFVRGGLAGYRWKNELEFILTRLICSVFLRDVITLSVIRDIRRGLPVIHANFFSYDEQAHRRGPSSRFAAWALQGLDASIRSIWQAARHRHGIHYDVWIYSDHGQEDVKPFAHVEGRDVKEVLKDYFETLSKEKKAYKTHSHNEWSIKRCEDPGESDWSAASLGPIIHVYSDKWLSDDASRETLATNLVLYHHLPFAFTMDSQNRVIFWDRDGKHEFDKEGERFIQNHGIYADELWKDWRSLVCHEDSGHIILCGWHPNHKAMSFPEEWGSHAGPGDTETHGFALIPKDAPFPDRDYQYLRPMDLREIAMRYLKRAPVCPPRKVSQENVQLKIMSYNIHGFRDAAGYSNFDRLCRVIKKHSPDVIGLQEVCLLSDSPHSPAPLSRLAEELGMYYAAIELYRVEGVAMGNAILSRYPIKILKEQLLPAHERRLFWEPRGALWVEVNVCGTTLRLINVHLSIWAKERLLQAQSLIRSIHEEESGDDRLILVGDFNTFKRSRVYRALTEGEKLADVKHMLKPRASMPTWYSRMPLYQIDYIFCRSGIKPKDFIVPRTFLEESASDHLPIIGIFEIPGPAK